MSMFMFDFVFFCARVTGFPYIPCFRDQRDTG